MKLMNYQEDLVLHITEIVLQDRGDVEYSQSLLLDVAAFTLNRLPPRYVVSERGFTRFMADHLFEEDNDENMGNLVEILLLANKAVDLIKDRRTMRHESSAENFDLAEDPVDFDAHWHNIPYLIGRVVSCKDDGPIENVKITLFRDDTLLEQVGTGWINPYQTSKAARGFYSFLPAPIKSDNDEEKFNLHLLFEHPDYMTLSIEQRVTTKGELSARYDFRNELFLNIGTACLEIPKGR